MAAPLVKEQEKPQQEGPQLESRPPAAPPLAQVGRWEWNLVTKKYSWCDEMFRIFNLSPQDVTLRTGSFFNRVHPEDKDMVVRAFGKALADRQPYLVEHRIIWPDGTVRFVRGQAEVRLDQAGRPVSMAGTIQDITWLQQARQAQ